MSFDCNWLRRWGHLLTISRRAAETSKNTAANARPQGTRAAGVGGSSGTMLKLYTDDVGRGFKVYISFSIFSFFSDIWIEILLLWWCWVWGSLPQCLCYSMSLIIKELIRIVSLQNLRKNGLLSIYIRSEIQRGNDCNDMFLGTEFLNINFCCKQIPKFQWSS